MEAPSPQDYRAERRAPAAGAFEQSPQHEKLLSDIQKSGAQYDLGKVSNQLNKLEHAESSTAFKSDLDRINKDFQEKGLLKHEGKDFELYESSKGHFDIRRAQDTKPNGEIDPKTGAPKAKDAPAKPPIILDQKTGEIIPPAKAATPEAVSPQREKGPAAPAESEAPHGRSARPRQHAESTERPHRRGGGGGRGGHGHGRRRHHGRRSHGGGRSDHGGRGHSRAEEPAEKPLDDTEVPETDGPRADLKPGPEQSDKSVAGQPDAGTVKGDTAPVQGDASSNAKVFSGPQAPDLGPQSADRALTGAVRTDIPKVPSDAGLRQGPKPLPPELQGIHDTIGRSPAKHTKDENALAIGAAVTQRARAEGLSDTSAKRLAQAFVAAGIVETMDTKNALGANDKSLDNTHLGDFHGRRPTSFGPFQQHQHGQLDDDIQGGKFVSSKMRPQDAMAPASAVERSFNHWKFRFEKEHKLSDLDKMEPREANEAIFKALKRSQAAGDRRYESKYRDYFPQAGELLARNDFYGALNRQSVDDRFADGKRI